MIKIGLTGGIGCGKTYIAGLLAQKGIPVYNSDSEAKHILSTDLAAQKQLSELIGKPIITDGIINKKILADFLFLNKSNADAVDSIIHPLVKADFLNWTLKSDSKWVILESAILIESGFRDVVDYLVVVDAPIEVRIERCKIRDHVEAEKIKERISMQMEQEQKCHFADFVIDNSGKVELLPQLDKMLENSDSCKIISTK